MKNEHTERGSGRALPLAVLLLALALLVPFTAAPAAAQQMDDDAPAADAAQAQEEPEEEEGSETPQAEYGEEIVVTARKREESLQKVPVAITVTSGAVLEDTAAPDISVLQNYVPNLAVYAGRNQTTTLTAFMRGIGQADPLWGVDPGVGLYLDEVYMARPQGALLDVFDVERVEVLRGPQGTLYGKNTIGGAIKYVSRAPSDDLEARISIAGGSYSTQNVRAILSGPIVEGKLRGKVAIASLQRDGFGENRFTGRDVADKDSTAFRVGLDWLASDAVTVQFAADRTEDDAEPRGYQRLVANPLCPLFLGTPCAPLDDRYDTQSGLAPLNSTDSEGYSMVVTWEMSPAWQFKSITAYRESDSENNIDFDTTPAPITDVIATYSDEQTSQEFQFLYTGPGRLNGVLGVYYFDGSAGGRVLNNFINLLFGSTEGTTDTESVAVFADGSYRLSDRLTLNGGLRVTEEEKSARAFNVGFTDGTFTTINAIVADFDKSETFTSVAPRIGLDYQFSDDVMGYVTASRGFKSGGFNVRAQATAFPRSAEPFDDEVLDVIEVGLKSILADRQLVLNTAAFYGDYSDIQVSTFTEYDSNGDGVDDAFFGDFLNAGDATLQGLEVEYDWNPRQVHWFGLQGHVSWLDAEPDSFLDANQDGIVDTQVITNAPDYTAALRFKLDFPAFGGLLTSTLGGNYRDDSVLTNEGLNPITQDAYGTVDLSIDWLDATGRWGFRVNGYNLTDEEYLTSGYNIPVLGIRTGAYGAPTTFTAGFEYRVF
jgi:iron complex outermembrane receptor protein